MKPWIELAPKDGEQIAEILTRRSNEIAGFKEQFRKPAVAGPAELPGSVELALSREIERLRDLADKVKPPKDEEE